MAVASAVFRGHVLKLSSNKPASLQGPVPCYHGIPCVSSSALATSTSQAPYTQNYTKGGLHTSTRRPGLQTSAYSADANFQQAGVGDPAPYRMGEVARQILTRTTAAMKRYGWISFWVQLTLSVVSAVILLFSVAFTSQSGPRASLYLTLIGILAGFLSTFWNFSYTRTGLKLQQYLDGVPGVKIKKPEVLDMVTRGVTINLLGLGSTLLGIQALVGVLVAKTLSNASANPFIATAAGVYNPVLALDVFLVQAATNMLLGHFLSMVCSLWLLSIVAEGRGVRFQRFLALRRLRERAESSKLVIGKGNATFTIPAAAVRGTPSFLGPTRPNVSTQASARSITAPTSPSTGSLDLVLPNSLNSVPALEGSTSPLRGSRPGWDIVTTSDINSIGMSSIRAVAAIENVIATTSGTALVAQPPPAVNNTQWGNKMKVGLAAPSPSGAVGLRRSRSTRSLSLSRARSVMGVPAVTNRVASGEMLVFADAASLSYLDGTLAGDMGFDPLGLFSPENDAGLMNQKWLRYSEVIHGRWAMLGVVGCLAPEVLAFEKIIPKERGVVWFKTGFLPTAGQDFDFGMDLVSYTWIMMIAMGFAEMRRLQDFMNPGSLATGQYLPLSLERALSTPPGQDPVYPGGPIFNFLGIVETEQAVKEFKEKEIRHGRLAMVAMLGMFAQAAATHDGPYTNLLDHMFDPIGSNILTNLAYINE